MPWGRDSYLAAPFSRIMCFRPPCAVHKAQRKIILLVYFRNNSFNIYKARFSFVLPAAIALQVNCIGNSSQDDKIFQAILSAKYCEYRGKIM